MIIPNQRSDLLNIAFILFDNTIYQIHIHKKMSPL